VRIQKSVGHDQTLYGLCGRTSTPPPSSSSNVKAARKLGMHTIRVELNRAKEALWQLERLLNVHLLAERPPAVRASL